MVGIRDTCHAIILKLIRLISCYIGQRGNGPPIDSDINTSVNAFWTGQLYLGIPAPLLMATASDMHVLQKKPMSMVTVIYLVVSLRHYYFHFTVLSSMALAVALLLHHGHIVCPSLGLLQQCSSQQQVFYWR